METNDYQGKSKQNHDAAELMAFIGVSAAMASILGYILFIIILSSCQAPEKVEPVKPPQFTRSYTIQPQFNGVTTFPKFVPILNGK